MSQTVRQPPRQRGAAARRREEQRRADRRLRIVVLGAAVAVLAVLGVVVLLSGGGTGSGSPSTTAPASRAVPAGVDPSTLAVPVAPGVALKPGAPRLYVWEDFQCPACAAVEQRTGDDVVALARSGDAEVFWRVTTFLDDRFPGESSQRAASAWGCAIDAGRAVEFHQAVFAAQPATEGTGWTQAELVRIGSASGIAAADLPGFRACVQGGDYRSWAARSTELFHREGVPGTPTAYLDGTALDIATLADPRALAAAVRQAQANG